MWQWFLSKRYCCDQQHFYRFQAICNLLYNSLGPLLKRPVPFSWSPTKDIVNISLFSFTCLNKMFLRKEINYENSAKSKRPFYPVLRAFFALENYKFNIFYGGHIVFNWWFFSALKFNLSLLPTSIFLVFYIIFNSN